MNPEIGSSRILLYISALGWRRVSCKAAEISDLLQANKQVWRIVFDCFSSRDCCSSTLIVELLFNSVTFWIFPVAWGKFVIVGTGFQIFSHVTTYVGSYYFLTSKLWPMMILHMRCSEIKGLKSSLIDFVTTCRTNKQKYRNLGRDVPVNYK